MAIKIILLTVLAFVLVGTTVSKSYGEQVIHRDLTFKAAGDNRLCQALLLDESNATDNSSNIITYKKRPAGEKKVLSLQNVGGSLELDDLGTLDFQPDNAAVTMGTFDLLNTGSSQNIYDIKGETHYFEGRILIITDRTVNQNNVSDLLKKYANADGDLDKLPDAAKAEGWAVVAGTLTPYKSARYTHFEIFHFEEKTYLLATALVPGPVAVALKFLPTGNMKAICVFDYP